jgi:hypothetical protein
MHQLWYLWRGPCDVPLIVQSNVSTEQLVVFITDHSNENSPVVQIAAD